jgi:hypothetical protein
MSTAPEASADDVVAAVSVVVSEDDAVDASVVAEADSSDDAIAEIAAVESSNCLS